VEPLVGAEARTSGSSTEQPAQPAAQFDQVLRRALPDERGALMRDYVRQHVMAVLRSDPTNPPDRHQRLMDLGMDSLMAVQLRGRLAQGLRLDRPLPASLMFDQPTIEALARHLLALVTPEPAEREPTGPVGAAADARVDENASRRDEVAAMSDAQIESLLLERLGKT
jgi:acyl carrier protein